MMASCSCISRQAASAEVSVGVRLADQARNSSTVSSGSCCRMRARRAADALLREAALRALCGSEVSVSEWLFVYGRCAVGAAPA
jgi:hypothetical protein